MCARVWSTHVQVDRLKSSNLVTPSQLDQEGVEAVGFIERVYRVFHCLQHAFSVSVQCAIFVQLFRVEFFEFREKGLVFWVSFEKPAEQIFMMKTFSRERRIISSTLCRSLSF